MRLLLDTHLILWWKAGNPRLPGGLPSLVDQADAVFVSRASLWEIAIKLSLTLFLDVDDESHHVFFFFDVHARHGFVEQEQPGLQG